MIQYDRVITDVDCQINLCVRGLSGEILLLTKKPITIPPLPIFSLMDLFERTRKNLH